MSELPRGAPATPTLDQSRRLVVKIGSALLVEEATGEIRRDWLTALADGMPEER